MRQSLIVLALVSALTAQPAKAGVEGWQQASDVAVYSLMTLSIAVPIAEKDTKGAFQAGGALIATSLITEGMKQTFPELRPDGSDRKSFPSAHASRAFAAAATLWTRQGKAWGIPAFAVAGFVGLARGEGRKHDWADIAVGAGLGTAAGFLITRKRNEETDTALIPWADTKGGGLSYYQQF